jgi:hypothetical protein
MRKSVTMATAVLLLVAGCQKLNYSSSIEVLPREVRQIDFSAPAYAQAVRASIDPESWSVSAYPVKASDVEAVQKALDANRKPDTKMLLAHKTFAATDSRNDFVLEGTVPVGR